MLSHNKGPTILILIVDAIGYLGSSRGEDLIDEEISGALSNCYPRIRRVVLGYTNSRGLPILR